MQCIYIHHLGPSDPVQHQQKGPSHFFQFHQQICSKLQGHLQSGTGNRKEKLRSINHHERQLPNINLQKAKYIFSIQF